MPNGKYRGRIPSKLLFALMATKHQSGEIVYQRYKITHILGKGGIGITYSAINLKTNSNVAIKAISLRMLDDWKQVELFEREASVLAKLDHPNIPQYLDYFDIETEKDKVFYIVQQQAPGKSLDQLIERGWRTTEKEIKQIAEQVLSILIYLHSQDPPVIHRDIKPHNLILSDDGRIFLVDFGAVQNTYYDTLMQGSTVVGTYGYMAPEQFRGKAKPTTDLYSLGATILYLLTHRSPAELPQNTLKLDFKSQVNVSEAFADWLEKILEPDPLDRFNSAKQALDRLYKKRSRSSIIRIKRKLTALSVFALAVIGVLSLNSNKQDILIRTGFYQKRLCSNMSLMKNYLKYGSDINIKLKIDDKPRLFLYCLIAKTDNELLNLIQERESQIQKKDVYQQILFYGFIKNNNYQAVEKIIQQGFDVNTEFKKDVKYEQKRDRYFCLNSTPIYEAILTNNLDIVKLLVKNGAKLNEHCQVNDSASTYNNDKIITPLSKAISLNQADIVKFLIENGAEIDYKLIPLTLSHLIAFEQYHGSVYELFIVLLENGLNPAEYNEFSKKEYISKIDNPWYKKTPEGHTPGKNAIIKYNSLLHFAQSKKKYKIIDLFNQHISRKTKVDK